MQVSKRRQTRANALIRSQAMGKEATKMEPHAGYTPKHKVSRTMFWLLQKLYRISLPKSISFMSVMRPCYSISTPCGYSNLLTTDLENSKTIFRSFIMVTGNSPFILTRWVDSGISISRTLLLAGGESGCYAA